jgi:formylmethanofuran dehydrogenase subunit C
MAYDPTHGFTVQEATNLKAYNDYNYEQIDISGDTLDSSPASATYVTESSPAKKVVIYDGDGTVEDADTFTIALNGNTDTQKKIVFEGRNLPFTIEGLVMTALTVSLPDGDTTTSDTIDILSFH